MSHSGKIRKRTLVGVFGWTLYSDHYGLSSSMYIWLAGEEIQCGRCTGSFSRRSLQDLQISCFESVTASSTYSRRQHNWEAFGLRRLSTRYSSWKKSTNRLSPCDCFHFLTVVIWLRSHSSEPFATHWQRGFDQPSNRNKLQETVLQSPRRAKI
jgi:hypothetical protein